MTAYVYRLVHRPTGKFYLGSTDDIDYRKYQHLNNLEKGRHPNCRLQKLFDKKNGKNFEWEVFPVKNRKAAFEHEQKLLAKYHDNKLMLNIGMHTVGGDNLTRNPRRKEIIEKIGRGAKGVWDNLSDEQYQERVALVQGENNPMYGKTHTKKVKKKLSEFHKGNTYALGCKRSEETKKKLSESASKRTGKKNAFYGKNHSEEAKARMREAALARDPLDKAQRKDISVDGKVFISLNEASRQLGIPAPTLSYRCKSKNPKYANVFYLE
ncbi:endonuclease [Dickeya phage vB_DsoM_JA29]|uniref:Putative GIY-YIG family homing endonuclease n=1 Tax=Dickeya phage vB_DsoM_JA29 TaxID=2283031 RepID=A0A384ZWY1_9CAUD|nr:endonuclease [Dickeya phage vB_DsoM_JA29]AXG66752.1 putative GIY-YIG family homing endonuclease [Dickeya phage vB_DsoM_JA29]